MRSSNRWTTRLGAVAAAACTVGLFLPVGAEAASAAPAVAVAPSQGAYHPLAPTRITDTRPGSGFANAGRTLGPGGTLTVTLPALSVPATANSVALSVTATNGTTNSYLSLYPTGQVPLTPTSVLNYVAGPQLCTTPDCVVPNLVITGQKGGQVTVANGSPTGSVDVVVDLEGYFDPTGVATDGTGQYLDLGGAQRVADTRCGDPSPPSVCTSEEAAATNNGFTLDAPPALGPGGILQVATTGVSQGGLGITAAVVQITATNTSGAPNGYLTAYPAGSTRPTASNVNFVAGQTTSTRAIVPVDANGNFDIYNAFGTADVVVDVAGLFTDSSASPGSFSLFTPITPSRLMDTRAGNALTPGENRAFPVAGQAGIPASNSPNPPTDAVLNVTEASATATGYLNVSPGPVVQPVTTSDLNFIAGETRANADLAQLDEQGNGTVNLYNYAGITQVAIDAYGYFSPLAQVG